MTSLVIIDYGSGNLRSVAKSFERVAAGSVDIRVSSDIADVAAASHIVLPGVGAFGDCAAGLASIPGMHEALSREVLTKKKPFLGICVGMQLLAEKGLEHGEHQGLGWIKGQVIAIDPGKEQRKIPHMGWNTLTIHQPQHPVLKEIHNGDHAYFVHSFYMDCTDKSVILSTVEYGAALPAIIGRDNIIATQFHPEKSQQTGLTLLNNFLKWRP